MSESRLSGSSPPLASWDIEVQVFALYPFLTVGSAGSQLPIT